MKDNLSPINVKWELLLSLAKTELSCASQIGNKFQKSNLLSPTCVLESFMNDTNNDDFHKLDLVNGRELGFHMSIASDHANYKRIPCISASCQNLLQRFSPAEFPHCLSFL